MPSVHLLVSQELNKEIMKVDRVRLAYVDVGEICLTDRCIAPIYPDIHHK